MLVNNTSFTVIATASMHLRDNRYKTALLELNTSRIFFNIIHMKVAQGQAMVQLFN